MDITSQGDDLVWRASEIDKGLNCMRALGYSRLGACSPEQEPLKAVPSTWSWALVGGLAIDDTLSAYERSRMGNPNTPTNSGLVDYYRDRFRVNTEEFSAKGQIVSSGEEDTPEHLLHYGTQILGIYQEFSKSWEPVGVQVEASAKVPLGDGTEVTLVGHIDYIRKTETNRIIGDWKFTKKTPSQMPAATYSRGWAYDLMCGDGSGAIELTLLRKGLKSPKIESTSHFVTQGEHKQVQRTISTLAKMYQKRYFPMASPDHWMCDPKWCNYYAICRGNPNGPAQIPGEV